MDAFTVRFIELINVGILIEYIYKRICISFFRAVLVQNPSIVRIHQPMVNAVWLQFCIYSILHHHSPSVTVDINFKCNLIKNQF